MKEPLRVLVVEDSEDDAQFVMSELRRGGFDPTFERVFNAEEMTAALADKVWDLVISDGSMPGLGSLTALSLVKEQQPDLPFIVVSGAVGEERVVAAMKAGANDYVTKNNLARLVPSIKQELRDAENRRTQPGLKDVAIHSSALWEDGKFIHSRCFTQDITRHQEAESARAHLAAIVESSEDAIIGKTLDGVILSWNAGAEELYGYTAQEMKGQPDSILIPSYRPEEMGEIYGQIRRGERIDRFETVRIHKDGRAIEVSLTLSPIKDATGRIVGVSAIERDITALKREEEERLQLIEELTVALASIKTLTGLLPICSSCKKIRDDHGYWQKVESYISAHTGAEFTHGICPDCLQKLYPEYPIGRTPATARERS